MSDEVRRIARRARRHGYDAIKLAAMSDEQWSRLATLIDCEDATDRELADAVDLLILWGQSPETVDDPDGRV